MTPQIVHRHTFTIADAVSALLPDIGDCDSWEIRVEGENVVVDIVEPAYTGQTIEVPADFDHEILCRMIEAGEFRTTTKPTQNMTENMPEPRKGGPLARKAGIICNEKGFWAFLGLLYDAEITSPEQCAAWLRTRCDIKSRVDLEHDERAASVFREIDRRYSLWLDGFD